MDRQFEIEISSEGNNDTIHFYGNIDGHAEGHLDELVNKISTNFVVMDFSKTGRINSTGIVLLLRSIKGLKTDKGADISITGTNRINTMLFKMTGIFLLAPGKMHP